ncbi:mercury(II) reductase [Leptospirillum ferriphilum]|uniref:mercury(II) reductase n=1 Tax=Leptospirillum ferriphilum TaxID=178606 RepID=UPI000987B8B8|nr:mercury(II) reductase [Leptospirillum ferriphilum]OOH83718.1 mercury(II) reductase [Leptospirillum ferriphilum]
MKNIAFQIQGMTCDHCARTVESTLRKVPGVSSASVSFSAGGGSAEVGDDLSLPALEQAVRQVGYRLIPADSVSSRTEDFSSPKAESGRSVVIIGAGSGAFAAALRVIELGGRVTLIERGTLGGTCVNVGCVPSKILIRQADHAWKPRTQPFDGIEHPNPGLHPLLLKRQRERRVLELQEEKYARILREMSQVTFLAGNASFVDARTVRVLLNGGEERTVSADRILIATGGRPSVPEIPGLSGTPYWTSTDALFSETVPSRLIVLGSGFVAAEIGQSLRRLGARVTVVGRRGSLLNRMDPDLGKGLERYLQEEGIRFVFRGEPRKVDYQKGLFRVDVDGETLEAEALLVATGRTPNTGDLALEKAGVSTNPKGEIVVNERLETNVPGIYAVGDCTNLPKFVYVAAAAGTRAATNMMGDGTVSLDLSVLPEVIFTDPQVAVVGLTGEDARKRGIAVEIRTVSLDQVPRALANFDTRGWVRMVAETTTGRLLGVQILAPEGGEVIQTAALAISAGKTVREIGDQLFPYLTMVESLKLCAQSFHKDVRQLSCCAG